MGQGSRLGLGSLRAWVWVGPMGLSWDSVSAGLVPGSPAWPKLSLGCPCLWKGQRGLSGALSGHLRVTAWSRMDVGPFRPGVVEVRPQPFLSTFSVVCCGPIDLCIRQTLRTDSHPKWCHLQPPQSLPFWRLSGHPLVLDLIVYASVEINPLFPSNRFILEACRINRDSGLVREN